MEKINFNFIKGDTFKKGITLENFNQEIQEIYFTMKEKSSDKNFVLQKRLNNGIIRDPNSTNRYILNIEADDTNDLKVNYNYIELRDILSLDDYYKTDTHWKQENLCKVVNRLGEYLEFYTKCNYEKKVYDNEQFYDNISCEDYLIYQLQFKKYDIEKELKYIAYNKENYETTVDGWFAAPEEIV
jgi:hypothetical protein